MIKEEELQDIHQRFEQTSGEIWIDVRTPEEWKEGTIPGVKKITLSELEEHLSDLPGEQTYVLVCRSGNRSGKAAKLMASKGFENLVNFKGGMMSWYKAGYKVV